MVEKNYLHTAYANSADGTDRFTTVYPNLNLLSQNDLIPGYLNDKGALIPPSAESNERTSPFLEVDASQSYTAQVFVTLAIQRSSWCGISWFDENQIFIKRTAFQELNVPISGNYTYHYTVQPPSNAKFVRISFRQWGDGKLKLEQGSTATPWMPSATEVTTAEWPKYVGTYVDTNLVSSTDPSKYGWDEMKHRVYLDGIAVAGSKLLSTKVENLKPDTSYTIQVKQVSGEEESDFSDSVTFKTNVQK
ncbi:fibronectin type III domain-containing protein [Lactococcus formosensis]|uniref:fibronectin type III domain-containing protein n=1 Tax=Lactococcus formosensis TaxID=1281486 RepID=UPI0024352DD3|nr:fibronectin type III domain-containing protein [Lactococcus formosensis]MDG6125091.1 fibronectin type III domain-containing protein [Lactococcus formosensis]MDG6148789.1 fibronectin type III domain-containing protein [Lactococcus formosensis]